MHIVIDMQGAQSEIGIRRLGRYPIGLARAIVRHCGHHEITLFLNGRFQETIEPIRAAFAELLPPQKIVVWEAPGPVDYLSAPKWRVDLAESIREYTISYLKPDIVLVTSLFEDFDGDTVISIGKTPCDIPTAVVFYDLVPFFHQLRREPYLENPLIEDFYLNKLDHLGRANLLLSVSESSRQDAIQYLRFDEGSVVNISAAADAQFTPRDVPSSRQHALRERYGVERPFVMYVAGMDQGNVEALIRGYARLPDQICRQHQLVIVDTVLHGFRWYLADVAQQNGLSTDDLVFTPCVPDQDLVDIYNLCTVFAVPSLHDTIGLRALEAMSCGAPVIGAKASSLPEVIGRDDALFNPHDDNDIAAKLSRVLDDQAFRRALARHGLERAKCFSWDTIAKRTLIALQRCVDRSEDRRRPIVVGSRPKLAFISPVPPEPSGISDYSAELLPELRRHYDIDVIVAQQDVDRSITVAFPIRTVDWFRDNAHRYDRVLYHFGNSPFHAHMFGLLEKIPGIVVLHDFFLSDLIAYLEAYGALPNGRSSELYGAHGYEAVRQFFHSSRSPEVLGRYPCNLGVLQRALGIIVHSANSLRLAEQWYGKNFADWAVIPLLRAPKITDNKSAERQALGFGTSDVIVCAFGMLGLAKLNHRLLQAWLKSRLGLDKSCHLIFVGENDGASYGAEMLAAIRDHAVDERIRITGRVSKDVYRQYLAVANIAVQLRTASRGETSAAVLDCMNCGIATIVNAHGAMADLDGEAVWKLPDEFADAQLIEALETLWNDPELRRKLGGRSRDIIAERHDPRACAELYHAAIERFSALAARGTYGLASTIAALDCKFDDRNLSEITNAVARNIPPRFRSRQLLVDISAVALRDLRTGIQRVVRSLTREWLIEPPPGFRCEPVYATKYGSYRYARQFTLGFLNCPSKLLEDDIAEFAAGDIFIILDYNTIVAENNRAFYQILRRKGVQVIFMVYDLLPVHMPQHFDTDDTESHTRWLQVVAESDGAVCISQAVADELTLWFKQNSPARHLPFGVAWFHSGADIVNSAPTFGLPAGARSVLDRLRSRTSFLIVSTLEPRKGHGQVLEAFDHLWQSGVDVNLVIVGQAGWMVTGLLQRLRGHPELNKRLFWLEGVSDEYLEQVYAASACLIAASEGEGFGLPLIEAARHKLPIICRNIPVFREVAGEHAWYFEGIEPHALASSIKVWLPLYQAGQHPKSDAITWMTWKQSAARLKEILLQGDWYATVTSDQGLRETAPRRSSEATVQAFAKEKRPRQLLLDVSETCRTERRTGIERAARALVLGFLENPPLGFRVEPVYLAQAGGLWHYRAARRFTRALLGHPSDVFNDHLVKPRAGDVLLGLDNSGDALLAAEAAGLYKYYRNRGVALYFTVYDLLPVRLPQYFPPGSSSNFEKWLRALLKMDGAVCISKTVADDFCDWARVSDSSRQSPFQVGWFHLGADVDKAAPTQGLPGDAARMLSAVAARPSFLMVGTIEPRKGYKQVLDAFDQLWREGLDLNLIIVGAEGWRNVPKKMRRSIPDILLRLQSHPEREVRLFWVVSPSDEYLEKIYAACCCLIAASEGEGFGLPLIEAARHGLPIIARDIPVFREVAGEHAFYFVGTQATPLTTAMKEWLALYREGKHPKSDAVPWKSWKHSVERLKDILLRNEWYARLSCANRPDEAPKTLLPRAIA